MKELLRGDDAVVWSVDHLLVLEGGGARTVWSWGDYTGGGNGKGGGKGAIALKPDGVLTTPWGAGIWGPLVSSGQVPACASASGEAVCVFFDFAGRQHNVAFYTVDGQTLAWYESTRVGDGALRRRTSSAS